MIYPSVLRLRMTLNNKTDADRCLIFTSPNMNLTKNETTGKEEYQNLNMTFFIFVAEESFQRNIYINFNEFKVNGIDHFGTKTNFFSSYFISSYVAHDSRDKDKSKIELWFKFGTQYNLNHSEISYTHAIYKFGTSFTSLFAFWSAFQIIVFTKYYNNQAYKVQQFERMEGINTDFNKKDIEQYKRTRLNPC